MSKVLIVKNVSVEGPGMIADVLSRKGYELDIVDLEKGEPVPGALDGIKALVVLGGPMNVYEEDKYPFLREEGRLINKAIDADMPFLGVCLGAQLLAKSAGAGVTRNPEKEIGFYTIDLSEGAGGDALFAGVQTTIDVFQWHGDTFAIPREGTHLASSELCENQAFRLGKKAYGLQFHVEVDDVIIKEWIDEYSESDDCPSAGEIEKMFKMHDEVKEDLHRNGLKILGNFARIIGK